MKNLLISVILTGAFAVTPVRAGDISAFGGVTLDDENFTSLALSIGFDVPKTLGLFSPSELRADIGYLFNEQSTPLNFIDGGENTILETDFGIFTAHAGPAWRLDAFNRASVFAGIQLGIAVIDNDSQFVGPIPPAVDVASELTDTRFSFQVPVGFEYSFTRRVGVTTRYRLLGISEFGGDDLSHIVEGGIIIKF
ncbi:MAG: hypothetical protein AAFR20_05930 [Pseudomonadota bacterium]